MTLSNVIICFYRICCKSRSENRPCSDSEQGRFSRVFLYGNFSVVGIVKNIPVISLRNYRAENTDKALDIEKIKKEYGGKITLVGGFSSQTVLENPDSTPEDIDADIQYAYDVLAPGGGYASFPVVIDMGAFAPKLVKKHLQIAKNY